MVGGTSRKRLLDRLGSAYANGLISDRTFEARVEQVLENTVVDPGALIGDLAFRRPRRSFRDFGSQTITALAERVGWARESDISSTLLALKWNSHSRELLLGRDSHCDVVLSDATVSRRHALLTFRDNTWIIEDLESKNGSFLNGRRVGRCELRPGDRLALGRARLLVD